MIKKMYEFLGLESRVVHLCERLWVLRSIYAKPPLLCLLNSQVLLDKKFKINKRINNKWKLEINQFMMDSFAKIY